jgi:hypothetical protein
MQRQSRGPVHRRGDRRRLAEEVARLREQGKPWDGLNGICERVGISGAQMGRKLLTEIGRDDLIVKQNYDRTDPAYRAKRGWRP